MEAKQRLPEAAVSSTVMSCVLPLQTPDVTLLAATRLPAGTFIPGST